MKDIMVTKFIRTTTVKPKILFIDIETSPNKGYFFQLYKENFNFETIEKERSIITFSYKWLGDDAVKGISILTFHKEGTTFDPYDDKKLVARICEIISEADYIVAHYGDKFDMRFIRARAVINKLPSPPPIPTIDTYKLCKKHFNLNANRLDYLGKLFGMGRKIPMNWSYWQRCAEGDKAAIRDMLKYNKQDVELLEKVFLHIQPHVETKISHSLFTNKTSEICESCGSSNLQKRGTICNKVSKKQRYQCSDCGSWTSYKIKENK